MKVLFITNMFPTPDRPHFGVFVQEQIDGLIKYSSFLEYKVMLIEGYKGSFNYLKSIFNINWHLMHNKYDVIHIHYGLSGLFLFFKLSKNKNIIITLHGSDINIESSNKLKVLITKQVIKRANYVICVNDKMLAKANRIDNVQVIPCGIDTDLFIPGKKNNKNILQIVFPSSSDRYEKNYQLFKSILNLLKKEVNVDIKEVKIENMSRQMVLKTLQETDVLLMTSISEGSPQIVKEAMSCNIPIISTDVGDVKNLLLNVKNSYVINSFLPKDFLKPLLEIINLDKENRQSNGRDRINELGINSRFTSEKLYKLYELVSKK